MRPALLHIAALTIALSAASCASDDAALRDSASAPSPTTRAPLSSSAVAKTRQELSALARDLALFDERLAPALSAVNFTIMRYPQCLDALFETYARLDLARREISLEEQDLRRAFDTVVATGENGLTLITLENRARGLRDRLQSMNADLANIFAEAMSQRPSCAPKEPAKSGEAPTPPRALP